MIGRKITVKEIEQETERKEEETYEWGVGLVQRQNREDLQKRIEEERDKPFARTAGLK
jgi:hypothetical protein